MSHEKVHHLSSARLIHDAKSPQFKLPEVIELPNPIGWLMWDEAVAQLDAKDALQASLTRHHQQVVSLFDDNLDADDLRLL